ncbi:uncharacterized protein TNCV_4765101 [Trichonephila clavipes]|nr:uncharacterized protein TNCV_4765101 [Trichonephila clavipes]
MPSLRDGNAIETFLMTAQINTDFVNHPVPSTTESSTSLVRVGTDACESIKSSILRYKDYDSDKNAHRDFQKRFLDNPSGDRCSICDRLWFRNYFRTPVGLVAFAVDRLRRDCCAWRMRFFSTARVTSEGRRDPIWVPSVPNTSTLSIKPKRSSTCDVWY